MDSLIAISVCLFPDLFFLFSCFPLPFSLVCPRFLVCFPCFPSSISWMSVLCVLSSWRVFLRIGFLASLLLVLLRFRYKRPFPTVAFCFLCFSFAYLPQRFYDAFLSVAFCALLSSVPQLSPWSWLSDVKLEYLPILYLPGCMVHRDVAHPLRRFVYDVSREP